jgi:transposase-like protein
MATLVPVRFVLSKRTFYITLSFPSQNSFQLQVWDGKTLWEGEKFGEALKDIIPEGMTHEYYFDILKDAFRIQDRDGKRFNYAIARHQVIKSDAVFKWIIKTKVDAGVEEEEPIIPIDLCGEMHLTVVLEDRAKKIIQTLMDSLLFNRNELEAENDSLKTLNAILKTQRSDALDLLNRLEQEKRAAEVEQFSKFVILLNAKKVKIAELRSKLQQLAALAENGGAISAGHSGTHGASRGAGSQKMEVDGSVKSKYSSQQSSPSMELGSIDILDPHFDSHEVYSLSTPQLSRKKSDLVLQGAFRTGPLSPGKSSMGKPQNIFESQTPGSLSSFPSNLKRLPSHSAKNVSSNMGPPARPRADYSASRRSRLDDILGGSLSDGEDFPSPEPKKWKR